MNISSHQKGIHKEKIENCLKKRERIEAISKETATNSMAYYIAIYSVFFIYQNMKVCSDTKMQMERKHFFEINIIRVKIVCDIHFM